MGDYSPPALPPPGYAVSDYLFTITLYSPYNYKVELKTSNSKKCCLRFNLRFALSNMTSPSNLKTVDYLCVKFCFILVHSADVIGGYLLEPSMHVITASASGLKKNAMERR